MWQNPKPLPADERECEFSDGPTRGPLPEDPIERLEIDFWRERNPSDLIEELEESASEELCGIELRERLKHLRLTLGSPRTYRRYSSDHDRVEYHNGRDWAGGTLTVKEWRELKLAYGGCAYCGAQCKPVVEHMKPVSRGGKTNAHNVVPACWACNQEKRTSTVEEWLSGSRLRAFKDRRRKANAKIRKARAS